jgi:hypothetical protein
VTKGLPELPRRWWSVDLPGYRDYPTYATYAAFDYEALPPIERKLDDDLAWIQREPVVMDSLGERPRGDPGPRREATAEQLDLLLGRRDIALPRAFRNFIRSTEPRLRVRSATACYLDLAEFAVPVVGGGWLIHFLSDQQWILHWLLFAGPDGSEAVVVTEDPLGFNPDEGSPRRFDREFDPSTSEAAVCAATFGEFLYRFWIENEIWFTLIDREHEARPLSVEQARYVRHYAPTTR